MDGADSIMNSGREIPGFPGLLWDLLRAGRGRPEGTALRQQARLRRLIEYARSRSPYYRERYAAVPRGACDLPALPPVTKSELMSNFDGWATDPAVTRETVEAFIADPTRIGVLYLDRYVAFSTSGTTGTPAVFLHDRGAISVYQGLLLARRLPTLIAAGAFRPFLRNRARTATIIATGGHFASSVVEALVRTRHPRLAGRNRTFSLMDPLPALVRALNEFQPAVVGSYPTALAVLAGEQAAGRLRIAPALLLSGAERLSAPLGKRITESFRCPLRDTYAASEFMGIAFDCRYGRLHVNADWLILEPVDAAGEPVAPGERLPHDAVDEPGQPRPAAPPLRPRRQRHRIPDAMSLRQPAPLHPAGRPARRDPVDRTRGRRVQAADPAGAGHGRGGGTGCPEVPGAPGGSEAPSAPPR